MACGICGAVNLKGLTKNDLDKFTKVLVNCRKRGWHASGVANQKLEYIKASEPVDKLVQLKEYKDWVKKSIGTKWVIGHARYATQGKPEDNKNNHPLSAMEDKYLLVHNGVVNTSLWDEDTNVTDTYIIADSIKRRWCEGDLFQTAKEAYRKFHGAAATAIISKNEIVLAKLVNPIMIKFVKRGQFFFASEEQFMRSVNGKVFAMPENTLYGWDKKGNTQKSPMLPTLSKPKYLQSYDWSNYTAPPDTRVVETDEDEGEENIVSYSNKGGFQRKIISKWNQPVRVKKHKRKIR